MTLGRVASLTVAVAASAILAACSAAAPTSTDPLEGYQHVSSSPSWAVWFTTLRELASKSDLAVSGTITMVVQVDNIGSDPSSGILQSTYEFTPDRVLSGDKSLIVDGRVMVTQTGGIDAEHKIILDITDDPRFVVGDTAVLFLTKVGDKLYAVQGGPSGRFDLKDGRVSAIVSDGVPIKDVPLGEFTEQIGK